MKHTDFPLNQLVFSCMGNLYTGFLVVKGLIGILTSIDFWATTTYDYVYALCIVLRGEFVAQLIVLASTSLGGPKVRAGVILISGFVFKQQENIMHEGTKTATGSPAFYA